MSASPPPQPAGPEPSPTTADPAPPPIDPAAPPAAAAGGAIRFRVGSSVGLAAQPRYLKTADPMPMLRPPDLIDPAEVGTVVECRALGIRAVRFRRGTFLLTEEQLIPSAAPLSGTP